MVKTCISCNNFECAKVLYNKEKIEPIDAEKCDNYISDDDNIRKF